RRLFAGRLGTTMGGEEEGGSVLVRLVEANLPRGRNHRPSDIAPAGIFLQLSGQPFLKGGAQEFETRVRQSRRHHVAPVVSPVLGILLTGQKLVDQLGALVRAGVGGEFGNIGRQRELAGQIQRYSAEELVVGGQRGRLDLFLLKLLGNQPIDLARLQGV